MTGPEDIRATATGAAEPADASRGGPEDNTADLPAVLAHLAAELPPAHRDAWLRVLHATPRPTPDLETRLLTAWPGGTRPDLAHALTRAWTATQPPPDGPALALALQAAAHAHTTAAESRRVDLVVSGPASTAVPVRHTTHVIAEVIRAAHTHLLIVSFAAYRIPDVTSELRAATRRGVHLDIILESPTEDGGTLRADPRTAFDTLTADYWHWPATSRPTTGTSRAALHAKLIAADDHTALLGSANLTGQALTNNLEIGVVLRNPHTVSRLVNHFRALMHPTTGVLKRL